MNMNFKTLAAFCALSIAMTGCAKTDADSNSGSTSTPLMNNNVSQTESEKVQNDAVNVSVPSSADCTITFANDKTEVNGNGAAAKDNTVTISKPGAYELKGNSANAKIIIKVGKSDEVTLMLNGVSLTSEDGSVIDCESGKTLALYLVDNTENTLADSAGYTFANGETEPDGAVFSRADLVIMGGGSLSVTGNYKDAVKCKDGLSIKSGTLNISAADDGIVGKDYVCISGGKITVNAQSDGIKSTNDADDGRGHITISGGELDITAEKDGIQAEKELAVEGGKLTIFAGGEDANAEVKASENPFDWDRRGGDPGDTSKTAESKKGLKAGGDITILGGEISVTSADDSVHSNANVSVSGGTLTLSSCDDGIHADESLSIKDGSITITKSYEGLEGKNIDISGGEINIVAADDGLNAAGGDNGSFWGFNGDGEDYYISVSGGNITVNADGDGVDSNGTIAQSGGYIVVYGPTNSGNGAIDYEQSYTLSGGTLIALGSSGMAQAPSTLSQPCLSINSDVSAGSTVEVRSSDGTVILSSETPKRCQSLIFTSDKLVIGEEYGIYANGELLSTLTAEEGVVGNGADGNGFGGGGFGGHGGFGGGQGGFGGGPGGMDRPDGNGFPNNGEAPPDNGGTPPELPGN